MLAIYYFFTSIYTVCLQVMRCQPFTYVIKDEAVQTTCDFCLRTVLKKSSNEDHNTNLKKCSKCKMIYYCDISCQKESWTSIHQQECQYLRKFSQNDHHILTDTIRMIIRTILKSQNKNVPNNAKKNYGVLPNGKKRYFEDLMSHHQDISDNIDPERFDFIYNQLQMCFPG